MDADLVVYRRRERLVILGELALDYEVEDLDTGVALIMDKEYFDKRYEAQGTLEELATIQELGAQIQQLKNRVNTVMNDMRYERKENGELRKQLGMKRKPPYRNGRKRGSHGHHW